MYFVYIIECDDKKFYTGVTSNLNRRYLEHKHGKGGKFTKDRKVIKFLYSESFLSKIDAFNRERQIKGWRREKKINLIKYKHPIRPV